MVQSPPRGFWSRTFGWCLIWKICHNMWSTVETKMPLGVRILPFRPYWLKERWSEETIRGIGEGRRVQAGKGCAEDLFSHYATYTERRVWVSTTRGGVIWPEFADGEIRWFGFNLQPFSSTLLLLLLLLWGCICTSTHDCTPLMGVALSQWAQEDAVMACIHKQARYIFTMPTRISLAWQRRLASREWVQ